MTRHKDFEELPGQPEGAEFSQRLSLPERRPSRFEIRPLFTKELALRQPGHAGMLLEKHFMDLSGHLRGYLKMCGVLDLEEGSLAQVTRATQELVREQVHHMHERPHHPPGFQVIMDQRLTDVAGAYTATVAESRRKLPQDFRNDYGLVQFHAHERKGLIAQVFDNFVGVEYGQWKTVQLGTGGIELAIEEFGIPEVPFHNGVPIYNSTTGAMYTDKKPIF